MPIIELLAKNGKPVFINSDHIARMDLIYREPEAGVQAIDMTRITLAGGTVSPYRVTVLENIEEIRHIIRTETINEALDLQSAVYRAVQSAMEGKEKREPLFVSDEEKAEILNFMIPSEKGDLKQ